MRETLERYATDRDALDRFYNVPLSLTALDRKQRFLEEWREELARSDLDALDLEGKIDAVVLDKDIAWRLRRLGHERERIAKAEGLLPFLRPLLDLEETRRRMVPAAANEVAGQLEETANALRDLRKSLAKGGEEGGFSGVDLHVAHKAIEQVSESLEAWHRHHGPYKPRDGWWVAKPYKKARKQLKRVGALLKKKSESVDDGLAGEPIGREALLSDLEREILPYGPEELVAIADRELAWCKERGEEAATELGHPGDWRAAVEDVKGRHVPLGEQDVLVADLAREAIEWVADHDLVTIDDLCRETWYVDMISEDDQRKWPFQAYGGQRILVSYPTRTMGHGAKAMAARGNNIHFTRAVVQHELIPGHHLQSYMGQRHRAYRRPFATPFLFEGWCLYWEMLLWDMGFPRDAADRVGMLFWRMHRCARIGVSLRFHLGEMTPGEMVRVLVDEVGHEPDNAKAEVRRYIGTDYSPLYQCAYMIGGLQVRALRAELVGSGKMTDREFHDAVLRENAIPVELIRCALTGIEPSAGHRSAWRFAD